MNNVARVGKGRRRPLPLVSSFSFPPLFNSFTMNRLHPIYISFFEFLGGNIKLNANR